MILYDSLSVTPMTVDYRGDTNPAGPAVTIAAQVDPLTTTETMTGGGSSTIITRYKVVTRTDVETLRPKYGDLSMKWKGKDVTVDGGFERHMLMGRLDHVEFFIIDV